MQLSLENVSMLVCSTNVSYIINFRSIEAKQALSGWGEGQDRQGDLLVSLNSMNQKIQCTTFVYIVRIGGTYSHKLHESSSTMLQSPRLNSEL